jgi:hypothetical protein
MTKSIQHEMEDGSDCESPTLSFPTLNSGVQDWLGDARGASPACPLVLFVSENGKWVDPALTALSR